MLCCWFASVGLIYGILFGVGKIILMETITGLLWLLFAAVMAGIIVRIMPEEIWMTAVAEGKLMNEGEEGESLRGQSVSGWNELKKELKKELKGTLIRAF